MLGIQMQVVNLDELFNEILTTDHPSTQPGSTVQPIIDCSSSVEKLKQLLESKDPQTRLSALIRLGKLQDLSSADTLAKRLDDENPEIAAAAVEALIDLGKPSLYVIEKVLLHKEYAARFSIQARGHAIEAAGRIPCAGSEIILRRLLDSNTLGEKAGHALLAMHLKTPQETLTNTREHWRLRKIAATVLAEDTSEQSMFRLYREVNEETNPLPVRVACLRSLTQRNTTQVLDPFMTILENKINAPELRVAAAIALGNTGKEDASLAVRHYAHDESTPEAVRFACLRAFVRLNDLHAALPFMILMNRPQNPESIQNLCVRVLSAIHDINTERSLVSALQSPYPSVRAAAAYSLGKLREASAERELQTCLEDDYCVWQRDSNRVGDLLLDGWDVQVFPVREAAAWALRQIASA